MTKQCDAGVDLIGRAPQVGAARRGLPGMVVLWPQYARLLT